MSKIKKPNVPYTYLIGWTEHKTYYYGVQYSKTAHPDNLWVKYFTSSKLVKSFRETYGEPDIIEIRHTFKTKEEALAWEFKVIFRMLMVKDTKWLNAGNAGKQFTHDGIPRSESCRAKISEKRKAYWDNLTVEERAIIAKTKKDYMNTPEAKENLSVKAKARYKDPEYMAKIKVSLNTPEYIEKRRILTTNLFKDPVYVEKHKQSVNTKEYKELQSKLSKERFNDDEYRKNHSDGIKAALASPEHRLLMSERAKASTEKRLATRRRNKELKEHNVIIPV